MQKYLDKYAEQLKRISEYSFYLAVFIELSIVILDKSEYIIQFEGQWFRLTFVLCCISLITVRHNVKEWLVFALCMLVGCNSYLHTGRNEIIRIVAFIWACQGKDMKKVLKAAFWYTAIGCAVIFLLSVTGIYGKVYIEDVFRRGGAWGVPGEVEIRYCFGMGHPNAFHCMLLVLTWLGIYCYHTKIKWYGYLLMGALHLLTYYFTDSKTGLLMSIGSLMIFILLYYVKPIQRMKFPYFMGILIIIGTVGFSVLMAKYSTQLPILAKLDGLMSNRIENLYWGTTNHEGMLNTWSLWSVARNDYYFDLGIIRVFYWYGIVPGILYFAAQMRLIWCGYKKKDYMLLGMIAVIMIYSVFEAHFVSDYIGRNYILFFFGMYLSDMVSWKKDERTIERTV